MCSSSHKRAVENSLSMTSKCGSLGSARSHFGKTGDLDGGVGSLKRTSFINVQTLTNILLKASLFVTLPRRNYLPEGMRGSAKTEKSDTTAIYV